MWYVIVNENMYDAEAWVEWHDDSEQDFGLSGWERIWSAHSTREEAQAALAEAKDYAAGRRLP